MDIIQTFYDDLAARYDKLFLDWKAESREQAQILGRLFADKGFDSSARILDCACGIGTQAIGLASLGYAVAASDISNAELELARANARDAGVNIKFERADFRALEKTFKERFDIVIAMDNALPHMLTAEDLAAAVRSITGRIAPGGMIAASIRDYDSILKDRPPYSPPYIYDTENGRRVCFQTWTWNNDNYRLVQYIIEDDGELRASKYECEYRAVRREELTKLLIDCGCVGAEWKMPEETGFYQPIVTAKKRQ